MKLTLFYDAKCPLCLAEMQQLKACDMQGKLVFENIHAPDFKQRYPYIDPDYANRILHGQLESGKIIKGLDVTHMAWSMVGKHKWLAILRWPMVRKIADVVYLVFARHRYRISRLLTGKPRCDSCTLN
ncbi:MAG: DUF393 domain-containing protein [Gammaproteobacteria bacterium]|nr:MAG: DUF393 domain-containing protein [Gammaproteobacteria bacterium]